MSEKYLEWMRASETEHLIQCAFEKPGVRLALKCVEAASPVLERFGCGIIADSGDVPCFLQVSMNRGLPGSLKEHSSGGGIGASLVVAEEEDPDRMHHLKCYGEDAKNLAAAFVLDFPDANFLYQPSTSAAAADMPKRMFLLVPDKQFPQQMAHHVMTFNNLKQLIEEGTTSFYVACE